MAAELIAATHAEILRLLANTTGIHFQGLGQAARTKSLCLSTKLRRHLAHLDVAHNLVRHITTVSAARLVDEVTQATSPHDEPPRRPPGFFGAGIPGTAQDGSPLVPAHTSSSPMEKHTASEATTPDAPQAKRLKNKRISAPGCPTQNTTSPTQDLSGHDKSSIFPLSPQGATGSRETTNLGHPRDEGWPASGSQREELTNQGHPRDAGWHASGSQRHGPSGSPDSRILIPSQCSETNYPYETWQELIPYSWNHAPSAMVLQRRNNLAYTVSGLTRPLGFLHGFCHTVYTTRSEVRLIRALGIWKGAMSLKEPPEGCSEASSSHSQQRITLIGPKAASPQRRSGPIRNDTYWIQSEHVPRVDSPAPKRGRSRPP